MIWICLSQHRVQCVLLISNRVLRCIILASLCLSMSETIFSNLCEHFSNGYLKMTTMTEKLRQKLCA